MNAQRFCWGQSSVNHAKTKQKDEHTTARKYVIALQNYMDKNDERMQNLIK